MKNLKLEKCHHYLTSIEDGIFTTYDAITASLYIATKHNLIIYDVSSKQVLKDLSLVEEYSLAQEHSIVSLQYLPEDNAVCIATSKGDLLLIDVGLGSIECVGSVDQGFTTAQWSPDMELLVLTTGTGTFVLMTRDFDPLCEFNLHTEDLGEAAQVNVGWGKKETQFHGSVGKEAAKQKNEKNISSKLEWDSGTTKITWRGDGQMFAISSINTSNDSRYIRIYNREGILQSSNELIEGLEDSLAWRPSGNMICSSQRKPNKHDVIFLEKNGLQHGEFTLPYKQNEKIVIELLWNISSDILTIILKDMKEDAYTVLLWTAGNYHWYLKQEIVIGGCKSNPNVFWDSENSYLLHIFKPDGSYSQYEYHYDIMQSYSDDNLAMVAVIDSSKLLVTPFQLMIVPPPMATYTLTTPCHINSLSFGPYHHKHDIIMQLADGGFQLATYKDNNFTVKALEFNTNGQTQYQHLKWYQPNLLVAVQNTFEGNYLLTFKIDVVNYKVELSYTLKIYEEVHSIVCNSSLDDSNKIIIQDVTGMFYSIDHDMGGYKPMEIKLPQKCSYVAYTEFDGKDIVFGLTDHHRLFMNTEEVANNCTSFLIHNEFLLMTTHSHTLRCVYLNSLYNSERLTDNSSFSIDESVRRVERGSKLVTAVKQGTAVILQMPRGNLESIHPRALVVSFLQKLLANLEYGKSMGIMRKNRINLNLMYDHDPKLFLEHTSEFITSVNSVSHINQFLTDLSPEDTCSTLYHPYYHHGDKKTQDTYKNKSSAKVDVVCSAVRKAIEDISTEKYFLSLLTTYAKQTQPDLETVLTKIKCLKDNPTAECPVKYEGALKYILYLVDVNQLFDIALGLYDFDIVLMVAERSQKDPKEYLPFLNNFKHMEKNYQRYSIDKYLKRYKKSLHHIAACEDRFNELVEFVNDHKLHRDALKLYKPSTLQYKKLSYQYAEYLSSAKLYEDAGIVYSRSGYHEEAITVLMKTTNWHLILTEAKTLNYTQDQLHTLCKDLCEVLKEHHMYEAAAMILENYMKDIEESIVCLLEGNLWFQAFDTIKSHSRDDLIETNLKPSLLEHADHYLDQIKELMVKFTTYKNRLKQVIEIKERETLEILQGIRDDPDNDLYSDTSSITGQSVSSVGSKGTRSTGRTAKSRNKLGRKKYSLREGSKHEDFALREALVEIVNTADKLKDDVGSILKVLVLFYYDEQASQLQIQLTELLDTVEANMEEIWSSQTVVNTTEDSYYGPNATVQSIIEQRNNKNMDVIPTDLPKPSQPRVRKSIHWKLHILRQ